MIKKANKTAETEKIMAVSSVVEPETPREGREDLIRSVGQPLSQREVNLMIHGWLTDMWLLTTGEEMAEENSKGKHTSHGRPLALASDGQMRLLGSRMTTLDALRDVGIEMS